VEQTAAIGEVDDDSANRCRIAGQTQLRACSETRFVLFAPKHDGVSAAVYDLQPEERITAIN
jgi:hypothetical protein